MTTLQGNRHRSLYRHGVRGMSRRGFIRSLLGAAVGLGLAPYASPSGAAAQATRVVSGGPLPLPGGDGLFGMLNPRGGVTLTAGLARQVLPATGGPMLTYAAEHEGRRYHNPVLVLERGQEFAARLVNGLQGLGPGPAAHDGGAAQHAGHSSPMSSGPKTIIHWHGVDCPWRQAGHPVYAVDPGDQYSYAFPVTNRAGTYWYHPHPHGDTARQAYLGLASFFIVRDDEEKAFAKELDLKLGVTDIPLVLQDKRFAPDGSLLYAPDEDALFMGYLGDHVLANGAHLPVLSAGTRLYRFRMLNGSTARIFNLSFVAAGGTGPLPMLLVTNDGGFLPAPQQVTGVFLAPGERVEVLLDLRAGRVGDEIWLRNMPFDPMHNEMDHGQGHGMTGGHEMPAMPGGHVMPGGMDHAGAPSAGHAPEQGGHAASAAASLGEGSDYPILRLSVDRAERYDRKVPERFSAPGESASGTGGGAGGEPAHERLLRLEAEGRRWTIAGHRFDMDSYPITVPDRRREVWVMENVARSMPHPMHLHGYFFRVRERRGSPAQVRARAIDNAGRLPTDLGLKDTVLVWPGETLLAEVNFGSPAYPGEQVFLFHCHNLEHEDQGMMLNVRVP